MRLWFVVLTFIPFVGFGQNSAHIWTELGIEGKITKKWRWGAEVNTRFGSNGLEAFFPQASIEYRVKKWIRPSIDYRFISDRKKQGYYDYNHRINCNLNFKIPIDRLILKARVRYQYAFDRLINSEFYEPEFDNAVRLRLGAEYDIQNFIFTPVINGEFFYDPNYGPYGRQINKLRLFVGLKTDFSGPHSFSAGYMYDNRINLPNPRTRHILNIGYTYQIGTGD